MPCPDIRIFGCLSIVVFCIPMTADADESLSRRARSILADRCYHCHGPDPETREAELRLDVKQAALDTAVVPGDAARSELIRRISSTSDDEVMPPRNSGKELSADEVNLLREWVNAGAPWEQHWSFVAPEEPQLPEIQLTSWPRNEIDHFVLAKLERDGLQPSSAADRITLARRLSYDLTGLPPTLEMVDQFVADDRVDAYERLVDSLLESPHYGERMAMVWLDAARYADTDGFQGDATRRNWPWRDWVIDAYNGNMPFDQFTIEQFAGDLLPNADASQILATCFHRNHMTNGEGGRDPEESRIDYVIDRVNTMGTVWLGLTLGCCQCHSHKYDPITQSEYYQLNGFFNSIDEDGRAGSAAKPYLQFTSPYVQVGLNDSRQWLARAEQELADVRAHELEQFPEWLARQADRIRQTDGFQSWKSAKAVQLLSTGGTSLQQNGDAIEVSGTDPRHDDYLINVQPDLPRVAAMRLKVLPSPRAHGRLSLSDDGHIILTNLKLRLRSRDGSRERDVAIKDAVASYEAADSGRVYGPIDTVLDDDPRTGWMTTGSRADQEKSAAFVLAEPLHLQQGESLVVELRQRSLRGYSNLQKFILEFTDEVGPAATSLEATPLEQFVKVASEDAMSTDLRARLQSQFLADRSVVRIAEENLQHARRRTDMYLSAAKPQSVMVLKEREQPRTTHVLIRGVWNSKGDTVSLGVPAVLADDTPALQDRLKLAQWLVHETNPLTARVTVNRYWQLYFGSGLVRTPDDFGTQGQLPTHPLLLDWLAREFVDSGWNVKQMQKLIVTSATYRQSSAVSPQLLERDPQNRLLARASRFRLSSGMIRDGALKISGLLTTRLGGPPVYPFQPVGAWLDATMGRYRYEASVGTDLYRRTLYGFWRRSVAPTGLFDAAKRRVCEVRTVRTNTPLHALTLMNDQTFVESARSLADQILQQQLDTPGQIRALFRSVLFRMPSESEVRILQSQLLQHQHEFHASPDAAQALVSVGQSMAVCPDIPQLAALTMLATTLLNLDEAITRE